MSEPRSRQAGGRLFVLVAIWERTETTGVTSAEAATTLTDEEKVKDPASLDEEAKEIRDRIERMGAVNVLAVEQAQEYEERHVFLTAQRQDLLDSIAEMDQAIRKIDRASRERFQEALARLEGGLVAHRPTCSTGRVCTSEEARSRPPASKSSGDSPSAGGGEREPNGDTESGQHVDERIGAEEAHLSTE